MSPVKASYFIREYIDLAVAERFPQSRTLQLEHDEIVTVLFGEAEPSVLMPKLNALKQVFDRDTDYYVVTIAVSSRYEKPSQFQQAYGEVRGLVLQRSLQAATEIMTEKRPSSEHAPVSAQQEQTLYTHIREGNTRLTQELLTAIVEQIDKKGATAHQFQQLALRLIEMLGEWSSKQQLELADDFDLTAAHAIRQCFTKEELLAYLQRTSAEAAEQFESAKSRKDVPLEVVFHYMESQLAEDISLEQAAERLSWSSGYLSNYIKQKTGQTFSEHLQTLRMNRAMELLGSTNKPVKDIAASVGYYNVTSFNRLFKKTTGLSPGDYRKRVSLGVE